MAKDWTGNSNSIYKTLGASNHTQEDRQNEDYYATEPKAAEWLLKLEQFDKNIWECACGQGHLSKIFEAAGHDVKSTDLINRGYGKGEIDFLAIDNLEWKGDIITNPPYKYAQQFIEKALQIIPEGNKVAMFLKIQFLESKGRKSLFLTNPPKTVYVSCSRLLCAKNAEFAKMIKGGGSAVSYAWYVWEKGFKGTTELKWFN
ncbi:MAG: hypothetical protein PHT69_02625 [Bacteroidales bacterium]|nr:hypothetical protein [Bacteroidales bacterium]